MGAVNVTYELSELIPRIARPLLVSDDIACARSCFAAMFELCKRDECVISIHFTCVDTTNERQFFFFKHRHEYDLKSLLAT